MTQLWWGQRGGVCLAEEARCLFQGWSVLRIDRYGNSVSTMMYISVSRFGCVFLYRHTQVLCFFYRAWLRKYRRAFSLAVKGEG